WRCVSRSRCALVFFFSSRRRHTRFSRDWSSDVCSSDLVPRAELRQKLPAEPPAVVGALHHMRPARLVTAVGVVVAGEKIAHLVRSEELRVGKECRASWARTQLAQNGRGSGNAWCGYARR